MVELPDRNVEMGNGKGNYNGAKPRLRRMWYPEALVGVWIISRVSNTLDSPQNVGDYVPVSVTRKGAGSAGRPWSEIIPLCCRFSRSL